jgi:branched-chain amino acid aminotransferase
MAQHLDRLAASADFLGFGSSVRAERLREALDEALAQAQMAEAYVRLTVSRGVGRGLTAPPTGQPTVMIEVRELSPYPARLYERGAELILSRYRRDETSPLSRHKTTNCLTAILAKREAAEAGRDDALLLNNRGHVAEATVSNVFIARDGRIVTPPLTAGILPGITRAAVLEICRAAGISCAEEVVTLGEVIAADEVFLTNTLMEIMPARGVAGRRVGDGAPGAITRDLARRYKRLVVTETRRP